VDIDTRDEVTRSSLLHFAACGGCGGATLKLLEANANPLVLDKFNRLPMIIALIHHYDTIAEILMEHKPLDFKRFKLSDQEFTEARSHFLIAMGRCIDSGSPELAEALFSWGQQLQLSPDVWITKRYEKTIIYAYETGLFNEHFWRRRDARGYSPLFQAAKNDLVQAAKTFIAGGQDVFEELENGTTLPQLAYCFSTTLYDYLRKMQAFQRQVLDIFDWTVSLSPLALKDDDFLKQVRQTPSCCQQLTISTAKNQNLQLRTSTARAVAGVLNSLHMPLPNLRKVVFDFRQMHLKSDAAAVLVASIGRIPSLEKVDICFAHGAISAESAEVLAQALSKIARQLVEVVLDVSHCALRSHAAGQIARALARGRDISNLKLDFRSNHLDDEFVLKLRDLLTSRGRLVRSTVRDPRDIRGITRKSDAGTEQERAPKQVTTTRLKSATSLDIRLSNNKFPESGLLLGDFFGSFTLTILKVSLDYCDIASDAFSSILEALRWDNLVHLELNCSGNVRIDSDVLATIADYVERHVPLKTFTLDLSTTKLRDAGATRILQGITGHANLQACKVALDGCGISATILSKLMEQVNYINNVIGPKKALLADGPIKDPEPVPGEPTFTGPW